MRACFRCIMHSNDNCVSTRTYIKCALCRTLDRILAKRESEIDKVNSEISRSVLYILICSDSMRPAVYTRTTPRPDAQPCNHARLRDECKLAGCPAKKIPTGSKHAKQDNHQIRKKVSQALSPSQCYRSCMSSLHAQPFTADRARRQMPEAKPAWH